MSLYIPKVGKIRLNNLNVNLKKLGQLSSSFLPPPVVGQLQKNENRKHGKYTTDYVQVFNWFARLWTQDRLWDAIDYLASELRVDRISRRRDTITRATLCATLSTANLIDVSTNKVLFDVLLKSNCLLKSKSMSISRN